MSFQGKKNRYVCEECKQGFVTLDVDEGVTPFMTGCQVEGCKGLAQSSFYRIDQSLPVTHEWYRPAPEDAAEMNAHTREHIDKGGLILRAVDGKTKLDAGGIAADSLPDGAEVGRTTLPNGAPDRLSVEPLSPFYDLAWLKRVGVLFNGIVQTKVVEYCVSEGWIRRHNNGPRGAKLTPRGKLQGVVFKTLGDVRVVVTKDEDGNDIKS